MYAQYVINNYKILYVNYNDFFKNINIIHNIIKCDIKLWNKYNKR